MSQTQIILDHLKDIRSITAIEASALYKCRSLSSRISELKKQGWKIKAIRKADRTGQRYVRYYLKSIRNAKTR